MNRSSELQIIDNAVKTLIDSIGIYEYNKIGVVNMALLQYLKNNFSNGFPNKTIESLSKESIDKELLKNIVKMQSIIQRRGYATVLNVNKPYDRIYLISEAEAVIYNLIKNEDIDYVNDILKEYPILYDLLIGSFVSNRYFNNDLGISALDDEDNINPNDQVLLQKIEEAYKDVLKTIDFVINTTQTKLGPSLTSEELTRRFQNYIINKDASGFTRTNGARDSLKSLTQDDIIKEMLKNMVKVGEINKSLGYDTLFEENPDYDNPNMTLEQAEEYINNLILINQKNIDVVFQTLNEHPILFNGLLSSFVKRRYYDSRFRALLDVKNLEDKNKGLYKLIDSYNQDNYGSSPKM